MKKPSILLSSVALLLPMLALGHSTANAEGTAGEHELTVQHYTDGALAVRHLLVKQGSDNDHIAVCGATDIPLGTVADEAAAAEERKHVRLLGKGSTKRMIASEAMATTGVPVFAAAAGKIALSGTVKVGTLHSVATGDGSIVEVLDHAPIVLNSPTTVAATRTILASEMDGRTFFFGHATEFAMTLPAPFVGARAKFVCTLAPSGASYTLVTPSSGNLIFGAVHSSTGGNASSQQSGDTITFADGAAVKGDEVYIESDGTSWFARAFCDADAGVTITQAS